MAITTPTYYKGEEAGTRLKATFNKTLTIPNPLISIGFYTHRRRLGLVYVGLIVLIYIILNFSWSRKVADCVLRWALNMSTT